MTAKVDVREPAIPGAVDTLLFGGKVRLLGFGKYYPNPQGVIEKQDWSLRAFNDVSEVGRPRSHSIMRYLPKIARDYQLGKMLYAPSPRFFNAQVCTESDTMKKRIAVSSDDYHDTVWLNRGADADAMIVNTPHTSVVSLGGCPLLLLYSKKRDLLGQAHTGRSSVINEPLGDKPDGRPHDSVVDNLLEHMGCFYDRTAARELQAVIAFSIPAEKFTHPFDHPVYGKKNLERSILISTKWGIECTPGFDDERAVEGRIDLDKLIRAQLRLRGVLSKNIRTIRLPKDWYTTRESEEDKLKRNLVLVQHL